MSEDGIVDHTFEYDSEICIRLGATSVARMIQGGVRGYMTCHGEQQPIFHDTLREALAEILKHLGHAEDREILLWGEPDGPAW